MNEEGSTLQRVVMHEGSLLTVHSFQEDGRNFIEVQTTPDGKFDRDTFERSMSYDVLLEVPPMGGLRVVEPLDGEDPPPRFVGVYAVTRHYGGPEEGGWWYDWHQHYISFPIEDKDADAVRQSVKELLVPMQPDHDRFSMANEGAEFVVYFEEEQGEHRTTERPYYE